MEHVPIVSAEALDIEAARGQNRHVVGGFVVPLASAPCTSISRAGRRIVAPRAGRLAARWRWAHAYAHARAAFERARDVARRTGTAKARRRALFRLRKFERVEAQVRRLRS